MLDFSGILLNYVTSPSLNLPEANQFSLSLKINDKLLPEIYPKFRIAGVYNRKFIV
jgi:hypothetical protein